MNGLVRLCASLYAGFAVEGKVFRDTACAARSGRTEDAMARFAGNVSLGLTHQPQTLTMHIRSGDIFSNW